MIATFLLLEIVSLMSTYNNVLGNFISYADESSDLDDDDYEESASEPEPEMGNRKIVSPVSGQSQFIESTLSELNKYPYLHTPIRKQDSVFFSFFSK